MKKLSILLLLVLVSLAAFAECNYKVVSGSPLNIRKEASADARVLGTFDSGSLIEVVSNKNGWAKVRYNGGYGYVMSRFIERIASGNEPTDNSAPAAEAYDYRGTDAPGSSEPTVSDFESQRKDASFEITYSASSFDDVKLSGSYGFSWTCLPWEIAPRLYAGIHFSPINFNYGLSDFNYDEIRLGPAIGYYFTPKIFIAAPLNLLCDVCFTDDDKTKLAWGMNFAPAIYLGGKGGVFLGPQLTVGFEKGSKSDFGFRAGIYF